MDFDDPHLEVGRIDIATYDGAANAVITTTMNLGNMAHRITNPESGTDLESGVATSGGGPPMPPQPPAAVDIAVEAELSSNYMLVLPGGFELMVDNDFALIEEYSDELEYSVFYCGGDETERLLTLLRYPGTSMLPLARDFVEALTVRGADQQRCHINRSQLKALVHQSRIEFLLFDAGNASLYRTLP
ncbi:hypothetical protein VMCG_08936 [Cytospora schulzeri]|uniref:Uncharacterized protein n=1 Tax=Cytospora schulzeri TaxID=448051 RepID=A0A423VNH2_9PEZI|nr:hypothetical protein VMCG_08936 [Valsa malicola]